METKKVVEKLLNLYPDVEITFGNSDKVLNTVTEYIEKHKWLVNESIPFEITIEQAFFSWYENVYAPQNYEMRKSGIYFLLSKYTDAELFDKVSTEMYYLLETNRYAYYNKACLILIIKETKNYFTKFVTKLKLKFLK